MRCQDLEELLDALLEGALDTHRHREAQAHLVGCARCRELIETARGNRELLAPEKALDLTRSILDRTSGPACARAQAQLCDWVDRALSGINAELVTQHLEHCGPCQELERALTWMRGELAGMARIEPDPRFTPEVLRATVWRPRRGRVARWRERWLELVLRPRFSWEAAYVFTLLLGLVVSIPKSPARELPPQAMTVLQGSMADVFRPSVWEQPRARLEGMGLELWERSVGRATGRAQRTESDLRTRWRRIQPPLADLRRHAAVARRALADKNFVYASLFWGRMRDDLGRIWQALWDPGTDPTQTNGAI